jgi:hypothetical protein
VPGFGLLTYIIIQQLASFLIVEGAVPALNRLQQLVKNPLSRHESRFCLEQPGMIPRPWALKAA